MAQTLTRLLVHAVFSTKNREAMISQSIAAELHAYLCGIARSHESPVLSVGGMPDHVHLLISQSKNIPLSELMMHLK